MRRVAVLASRREIDSPAALAAAHRLGQLLGENRILALVLAPVTGAVETMVAAATGAGGRCTVVAAAEPGPVSAEVEIAMTDSPDSARSTLASRADAFIVLPGAVDSLDDAFAVWNWATEPMVERPLGVWDDDGFFGRLLEEASDQAVDRFARESQRGQLVVSRDPADLLRRLADYRPPETRRTASSFDDD